jgi:DNA replication and repair protein RecF
LRAPGRRQRRLPVPDHAYPLGGLIDANGRLIVDTVSLRDFRSYARLELELKPGLVLVVGPNGAGKTNLLESLHVGTQGFSPRTRNDASLIRFGREGARIALHGDRAGSPVELNVVLQLGAAKRASLNGARLQSAEQLRSEVATLVFTPDRLVVIKGGPAARRAYFDRALGRGTPSKAALPAEYGAALAQRNASLRGISLGYSSHDALRPWTKRVAELGAQLVEARREVIAALEPSFAARAGELGLSDAALHYKADPPSVESLEARFERDLDRGATGAGPHLDDIEILAGSRDLRAFGSQGEQRLAVLALLLAEAELVRERRGVPPLLLLDDVLSELDPDRRRVLAERLPAYGQALITTTSTGALPVEPDQLVEVEAGEAGTVLR